MAAGPDQHAHAELRENISTLAGIVSVVSERLFHTNDTLKQLAQDSREMGSLYNELVRVNQRTLHAVETVTQAVSEHRKDTDKGEAQINKMVALIEGIRTQLSDKISKLGEVESAIYRNLETLVKKLEEVRSERARENDRDASGLATLPVWAKIAFGIGVGALGIWKLIELFIRISGVGG